MPYNSASALNIAPYGSPYTAPGAWQNTPYPQSMISDPYAGVEYTGNQNYTPPAPDISEYWNEETSGYGEMPQYGEGYEPYDVTAQYQPTYIDPSQTDWANANMYAPWSHPEGPGGVSSANQWELMQNPAFYGGGYKPASGGGSRFGNSEGAMIGAAGGGMGGMAAGAGAYGAGWGTGMTGMAGVMGSGMLGPAGLAGAAIGYGLNAAGAFDKKKKRQSLDYTAPSYQGYMFTPEEGFPEYYNPSMETQNQTQQEMYDQQPTYGGDLGLAQPMTTGENSYDYNYTGGGQQNYVGQQDYNYGSLYRGNENNLYETFKPSM